MQYTNRQEQPYKKNHAIYKPYQHNSEIQTYKINGVRKIMQYTNRQEKPCNILTVLEQQCTVHEIQTDKNNSIRKTMQYTNRQDQQCKKNHV